MQYKFYEDAHELEPQSPGSRAGSPPGKYTAVGLLDGPVPAETSHRTHFPIALFIRIAVALILAAIAVGSMLLIFGR